ncbi:MAG: hypothetical protein U5N86_06420 [Planctomycetota bacterium]|nr:hypothetical protein [Planctomycetota bacterium]
MKEQDKFDPNTVNRYSIHDRKHLVDREDFCSLDCDAEAVDEFIDTLPDILAARELRAVVEAIITARRAGRMVHMAMGAHVVKVGLAPVVNDLVTRGILTGLSFNGAAVVHDLELALIGKTSEDVANALGDGSFGFCEDTAQHYHRAARNAAESRKGLGYEVGKLVEEGGLPYRSDSIFGAAYRAGALATVHCAFGTDIVHMHPEMDAEALARATHDDFLKLAHALRSLDGGVYINAGSAVILPEVFLKALSMARNVGDGRGEFTAVNLDMIRHYRPSENVLRRPGGRAINITGHHEIMLPLIRASLVAKMEKAR